jgi:RNA polymerase sigma factor for flagellar operon FliA
LAAELGTGIDELRDRLGGLARAEVHSLNLVARSQEESAIEVIDTLEAPTGLCDPERSALANERSRVVREAISGLSERHQQILTMLYVWEMPGAEVGRVIGVSESRVSQIASSMRTTLRQRIEAYDEIVERDAA